MTDENMTAEEAWAKVVHEGERAVRAGLWNVGLASTLLAATVAWGAVRAMARPDPHTVGECVLPVGLGAMSLAATWGWYHSLKGRLAMARHVQKMVGLLETMSMFSPMVAAINEAHAQGLPIVIHPPGVEPPEGHQEARPVLH